MNKAEAKKVFDELVESELFKALARARSASWKWITADELVTPNPCILSYVILTAKNNNCTLTMHDGQDTNGEVIAVLETTANQSRPFAFHDHIQTKQGLYVNLSGDVLGILIVWHDIPKSLGG